MKKYKSDVFRSIHEMMEGLYEVGGVSVSEMHEYDVDCLVPSAVPNREAVSIGTDSDRRSPVPAVAAPHT